MLKLKGDCGACLQEPHAGGQQGQDGHCVPPWGHHGIRLHKGFWPGSGLMELKESSWNL